MDGGTFGLLHELRGATARAGGAGGEALRSAVCGGGDKGMPPTGLGPLLRGGGEGEKARIKIISPAATR